MFGVDNLDELLSRLAKHGAEVVGYIRGVEGLLIGLAEQLGDRTVGDILDES